MCVTVIQMAGYAVPSKKVKLREQAVPNFNAIMKGFSAYPFKDDITIYAFRTCNSICECGDEEGDGREFVRDTFRPLVFDEDDMEIYAPNKESLLSKLKETGLDKYATYGIYTDAEIDNH